MNNLSTTLFIAMISLMVSGCTLEASVNNGNPSSDSAGIISATKPEPETPITRSTVIVNLPNGRK